MAPPRGPVAVALAVAAAFLVSAAPCRAADPEEAQYNVVAKLYNAGQWQAALQKIAERESQKLSPAMQARYAYARGLALEAGKRSADARRAYAEVVEKHAAAPEAAKARLALVFIDHAAGDFKAVLADCAGLDARSLSRDDRRQVALVRADAALALDDPRQALPACEEALSLGAARADVASKLFAIHQKLGGHAELAKLAAEAVPGIPDDARRMVRAEALLALGKAAEAESEARAVPPQSPHSPRARLALAQALVRQEKLVDAVEPLAEAIRGLKDPPAPPSARVLLGECLLAAGRPADAQRALAEAEQAAAALPPADRDALRGQAALIRIRAAAAGKDAKALAAAVEAARETLPADKRAQAVALRLFALHEARDDAALLAGMEADLAALRDAPQEGAATLILAAALERRSRADEARRILESFLERRPNDAEAPRAMLSLANAALGRGDFARARKLLEGFVATRDVGTRFGHDTLAEAFYNLAVTAMKLDDPRAAMTALERLRPIAQKTPPLLARSFVLLGQLRASAQEWPAAVAAWREALAVGEGIDAADVRSRLARALVAAGKPAEARAEFEALTKAVGDPARLSADDREAWARALFATGDFAAAATIYDGLARSAEGTARQAYEAGVCSERAERWADAERAYALAERRRESLPAEYAAALPDALARTRLRTGAGDRGLAHWIGRLEPATADADFESALATLATIAGGTAAVTAPLDRLEKLAAEYGPTSPRRFGVGAVLLPFAAATDVARLRRLAPRLAEEYAAAEPSLPADTWCTTVAPAMIHFYAGEARRAAGDHAAALAAYETVLSAHPFNEWPDAAACGAAECYAALGDAPTAIARLREVAAGATAGGPASTWIEIARRRLAELSPTEPRGEGR